MIFDINGMISGFIGEGVKIVLFVIVSCKFFMCLVFDQDFDKIVLFVSDFLNEIVLDIVELEVCFYYGVSLVIVLCDGVVVKVVEKVFEIGFGNYLVFVCEGGFIFVVNIFQEVLGVESLLVGFGFLDDNFYVFNEYFCIVDFYCGVVIMVVFFEEYGKGEV